MKKLFVLIVMVVASVSVASAQGWGIGARLGTSEQVVIQKYLASDNYWELRAGYTLFHGGGFDASLLYTWNLKNWDWTPGNWFLDLGAGLNIGTGRNRLYLGVQAAGKFGYTLPNGRWSFSFDVSPSLGPNIGLKKGYKTVFDWDRGILSSAISAVYKF